MYRVYIVILSLLVIMPPFSQAQDEVANYVIYRESDGNAFNNLEGDLYSVNLDTDEVTRLTEDGVARYDITSNGTVIYLDNDGNLYRTNVEGGTAMLLADSGIRQDYQISNNGMYIAIVRFDDNPGLFSISIEDGVQNMLNSEQLTLKYQPYDTSTIVKFTPDSSYVVFTAENARGVFHLYAVPSNGGEVVQVSPRLTSGGNVTNFTITPDSNRVVYRADQTADEVYGLFDVPLMGGDANELFLWPPNLIIYPNFSVSPNAEFVVSYDADVTFSVSLEDGIVREMPFKGSSFIPLRDSVIIRIGGNYLYHAGYDGVEIQGFNRDRPAVGSFRVLPDDEVLFWTNDVTFNQSQLLATNLSTGVSTPLGERILADPAPEPETHWYHYASASPDNAYAVYFARDENEIPQLYSVPISGGTPVRLNEFSGSRRFHGHMLRITPDSEMVVYINDEEAEQFADLYRVAISGGSSERLTPDDTMGVVDFKLFPAGSSWINE